MDKTLRKALYPAVVTFPASKTIGAVTLTGDVIGTYENDTFGPTKIMLAEADASKVGVSVVATTYGSWDGGTTFLAIDEDKTLVNGTGAKNAMVAVGSLIPRVRVDAAISTLTLAHGLAIDVAIDEASNGARKEVTAATTISEAISGVSTFYTEALSLATPALLDYAGMAIIVEDSSDITVGTTIGYKMQSSMDGVYWWNMASDVTDGLVVTDTDAPVYIEVAYETGLGKYVRLALTGTTSSALAPAAIVVHGILS